MNHHNTVKVPSGQSGDGMILVTKERGETLAVLLERMRIEHGIAAGVPMTYAGRLDPMAEGSVVILVGGKCKEKDAYLGLDKEYEFEVLLGVGTDTADVLGMVKNVLFGTTADAHVIEQAVSDMKGDMTLPYPMYSSKTVDGVPLLVHAQNGTLPKEIPLQQGTVYDIAVLSIRTEALQNLVPMITRDIQKVAGNFRQEIIIAKWQECLRANPGVVVQIVSCRTTVSSGVYIRSLAEATGKAIGVPALAYSIKRTRIGEWHG